MKWLKRNTIKNRETTEPPDDASSADVDSPDSSDRQVEEEYISRKIEAFPSGDDSLLVYRFDGGSFDKLPAELDFILPHTRRFRSLSGHLKKLLSLGWQNDGSGLAATTLEELVRRGYLRSRSEFLESLRNRPSDGEPPPIGTIGWITAGRPAALERSVESFIANNREYKRQVRYIVLDDSREDAAVEDTRSRLAELSRRHGVEVQYAGDDEKEKYVRSLIEESAGKGVPERVVRFALQDSFGCGTPIGANRNALLLAAAGEMVLSADDDSICDLAVPPVRNEGLELYSFFNPAEVYFYPDRESLLEAMTEETGDILSYHEKLLGKSVSTCLSGVPESGRVKLDEVTPDMVDFLAKNDAAVSVTSSGVFGDSGMGSPRLILAMRGTRRERMLESEESYRQAGSSREILRAVSRFTVSEGTFFGGFNIGLDNRGILPPFFPVLRNEDILFGSTIRTCMRNALIGHIPVAVQHSPVGSREYPSESMFDVSPKISEIIILLFQMFLDTPHSSDPAGRMKELGLYLRSMGEMSGLEFEEIIKLSWMTNISQFIEHLKKLLRRYDESPEYWAEDVYTYMDSVERFSLEDTVTEPADLRGVFPKEELAGVGRRLVAGFGELMYFWPEICITAKELNASGNTLVKPI